jgi:hypothetical protein
MDAKGTRDSLCGMLLPGLEIHGTSTSVFINSIMQPLVAKHTYKKLTKKQTKNAE